MNCSETTDDEKSKAAWQKYHEARKAGNLERILAVIDSMEQVKLVSPAKADHMRGLGYDAGWKMRIAEHYYKKAYEKYAFNPSQDWDSYTDAGYRWACLRFGRGDTEGALNVITGLLPQAKENKAFPKRVEAALLMLMADCQIQLHHNAEARRNWQKAYEIQQSNRDNQAADLLWISLSISASLFNMGDVEGAQKWLERAEQEFPQYEQQGDSLIIEEWKGHLALRRARYQQATGHVAEAAATYAAVPRSCIMEPHGYMEAAEYLMDAGRYDEAAYWYEQMDHSYVATDGAQMTFENIASRLSPRYSAYRKAGRNGEAIVIADSINAAIDSALVWQKKNDASELSIIYQTHEKELALEESEAKTAIYRILAVTTFLVCGFLVYLFWRAVQNNKVLFEKNRRLVVEKEQREREEQQVVELLKSEPEEQLTPNQQLFRRICELMDSPEHIYTDTDLDRLRLAQLLGTNEHYITDAISACANGKSVSGFLNDYRLRYASHLLATTDNSVTLIAELSGFSRSSFFRVFSDAYGMSPSDYRKVAKK
jgi:AraC-like DNA-binding protein